MGGPGSHRNLWPAVSWRTQARPLSGLPQKPRKLGSHWLSSLPLGSAGAVSACRLPSLTALQLWEARGLATSPHFPWGLKGILHLGKTGKHTLPLDLLYVASFYSELWIFLTLYIWPALLTETLYSVVWPYPWRMTLHGCFQTQAPMDQIKMLFCKKKIRPEEVVQAGMFPLEPQDTPWRLAHAEGHY